MFLFLTCFSLSIQIQKVGSARAKEIMSNGFTFMIFAPASEFEFASITRSFMRSAHLSTVEANFLIIDTTANGEPTEFRLTQYPALVFAENGIVRRVQYRGFDEEFILAFINTNAINPIPVISTKKELENFYSTSALGLIISLSETSEDKLPHIYEFYRNHFHDTSVVFADPSLFEKTGFYLYRYLDSTVTPLPDLIGKPQHAIEQILSDHMIPEFSKLNSYLATDYENENQIFAILLISMEDFYLSPQQLEIARKIRQETGINITYTDIENSQIVSFRYGLPDSLDSTMAIIDSRGDRITKYMISKPLTGDNAVEFVNDAKNRKIEPFWRSEIDTVSGDKLITQVTANTLVQLIKEKKNCVIALYYSNQEGLANYLSVVKPLASDNKSGFVFGKFSLALNDWSGPYIEAEELPYLVVIKNGILHYNQKLEETEEGVVKQINKAMNQNQEL